MANINKTNLNEIQGLIAGDGELPVLMAKAAVKAGHKLVIISLSGSNRKELSKYSDKIYEFGPGEFIKIFEALNKENVKQLTFIGKVSKSVIIKNPRLDSKALNLIKSAKRLNDDALMLGIIKLLDDENMEVLDQTLFTTETFPKKGLIGNIKPTKEQLNDIEYGFSIAKESGRMDIGQTVVVQNKMILAVEAIEGTDKAIERGCRLGSSNAVIVKVSKPEQDQRFDIPAVGLKTLKTIKRYGGKVLAIEAGKTFVVDKDKVIKFADRHNIVIIAV